MQRLQTELEQPILCDRCGSSLLRGGKKTRIVQEGNQVIWRGCSSCWDLVKQDLVSYRLMISRMQTYRSLLLDALDLRTWERPKDFFARIRAALGQEEPHV